MVNVHDHAHTLARALKESQEHQAFLAAKSRIAGKAKAEELIADFHRKQMELQAQVLQGKGVSNEQQDSLQRLYTVLAQDPDIREYLAAEQRLGTLVSDIYKIIGQAIEVELPFA